MFLAALFLPKWGEAWRSHLFMPVSLVEGEPLQPAFTEQAGLGAGDSGGSEQCWD